MQISILADNVVTLYVYISDLKKFFSLFILNWKIIALQYCIGFYQTSAWISHRFTKPVSPPTWASLPPPSLFHNSRLSQSPGLSSLSHTENSHLLSILHMVMYVSLGFLVAQRLKHLPVSACNVGDLGLIPWSGRSSGEGNGNPLQYSCLENPIDRGAWWAAVHGVAKSWTRLHFHFQCMFPCYSLHASHLLSRPPPKCVYNFVT